MRINITTIATPTTPPATAPTGTLLLLAPVSGTTAINISNATNAATLVYNYIHTHQVQGNNYTCYTMQELVSFASILIARLHSVIYSAL